MATKSNSETSSAGYRKNFDYSAAIAATQNESERRQLLAERQNKIDAEGLAGKVASNDAVSTWTGNYRPYQVSSTKSGALQVKELYSAAEQARLRSFETARQRIAANLQSSLQSIDNDYAAGMRRTEINALRSVITNEEKLAALGLNMGARNAAPTSGAAETSRIAVDNQYRSDLNALNTAHLNARAAAQTAAQDREAALEESYFAGESSAALQQAQAGLAQYNADRDYSLSVAGLTGFLNGTSTLAWRQYQSSAASQAQRTAYEQALARWKAAGYVLRSDAAVLGVPAGTPTADASYQNAALSLQRWKAGYGS